MDKKLKELTEEAARIRGQIFIFKTEMDLAALIETELGSLRDKSLPEESFKEACDQAAGKCRRYIEHIAPILKP